jgi:hypothetical protein
MRQKRHLSVYNHSKVFDLINPFERRPINRINEFNGLHVATEGYRFAFTSVQIKFITATPLAQAV